MLGGAAIGTGPKTDFIITETGRTDYRHIAIDEHGETITDHYRENGGSPLPPPLPPIVN